MLRNSDIKTIGEEVGKVIWHDQPINGTRLMGWLLFEANPIPQKDELFKVVSDIDRICEIYVSNGKVSHFYNCQQEKHELDDLLQMAIATIKERKYKLAIYPETVFNNQPLVVALEPTIDYFKYPDHPHLNGGGFHPQYGYIPDCLCYIADPNKLGETKTDKVINAVYEAVVWLLRHEVWLATRKIERPGRWIGPGAPKLEGKYYFETIDPRGFCHCGREIPYYKCHMIEDIQSNGNSKVNAMAKQANLMVDERFKKRRRCQETVIQSLNRVCC